MTVRVITLMLSRKLISVASNNTDIKISGKQKWDFASYIAWLEVQNMVNMPTVRVDNINFITNWNLCDETQAESINKN